MDLEQAIKQVLAAAERQAEATHESIAAARGAEAAAREAATAANAATAAANATTTEVHRLSRGQAILRRHVDSLWARVFGGAPVSPPDGVDPSLVPAESWSDPPLAMVVEDAAFKTSSNSLELAALEGRMINGFAAMQKEIRENITSELRAQSREMGLDKRGWNFLLSKAGQRSILRTVAAVGAVVAAVGGIASACRAPSSPAPAPAPTMIVLPAPPTSTSPAGVSHP
jgi:hypothetical protein